MNPRLAVKLVLFFTHGMSLKQWEEVGMFDREVALYRRLQERGIQASFVTYGDTTDLEYAKRIPGVTILCNRWGLPSRAYKLALPILHASALRKCDVIKTNQLKGAEAAVRAARIWRKPLIARCGFMWSELAGSGGAARHAETALAHRTEREVFSVADRIVVTTSAMRECAIQKYALPPEKVRVIPNYVLTDLFSPDSTRPIPRRLCFVGRLSSEKNLLALVEACAGLDVDLVIVGEGPLRESIQQQAQRLSVKLTLMGSVPHFDLPEILRRCSLFLLVSTHEGHPKTLLEAMSCGLPVIGADSPGIRELIRHGETGWLCAGDSVGIRAAIVKLLDQPDLCADLNRNAREFVLKHFSLDRVVELELDLLREVTGT